MWLVLTCRNLRRLCRRLFMLGGATGVVSGAVLFLFREELTHAAIRDHDARRQLHGWVWLLVCLCQPLNAGVPTFRLVCARPSTMHSLAEMADNLGTRLVELKQGIELEYYAGRYQ